MQTSVATCIIAIALTYMYIDETNLMNSSHIERSSGKVIDY